MKKKRKQYFWCIAVVVYVLFIFSNSMKDSGLSSEDSGSALRIVQWLLNLSGVHSALITEHIIRKAAHFTEYAVLGGLLCICFKMFAMTMDRRMLTQVLASFLVPFVDETIQLFVPGRSGQLSDVWLDCSGVAFGTVVFAVTVWIVGRMGADKRRIKSKEKSKCRDN